MEGKRKAASVEMPGPAEPMTEAERAEAERQIGVVVGARVVIEEVGG